VSPEVLEQAREHIARTNKTATLPIWPDAWHALQLFLALHTQWHLVASMMGVRWQGLNYAAIPYGMLAARAEVPVDLRRPLAEIMPQLQVLEFHAAAWKNSH